MSTFLPPEFPVIDALVTRHAEDAAFYWSQLDRAARSTTIRPDRLRHFDDLLEAHLDGLLVAGPHGWKPAATALARWKKAGEAFVCTWLAAQTDGHARLDEVLVVADASPHSVMRGLISALAWLPINVSIPVIGRWSCGMAIPVAQVAALRAAALIGADAVSVLGRPLSDFFASPDSHIRAAACRAAVHDQTAAVYSALRDGLTDPALAVRAEAAITLGGQEDSSWPRQVLLRCVLDQAVIEAGASGWNRSQAGRRLERWVRELALMTPFSASDTDAILSALPRRAALGFALAHGNLSHLAFVTNLTGDPAVGRYAGWVWQSMTGVDLAKAGLTLPEPSASVVQDQGISKARLDADNGLPQPDMAALQLYLVAHAGKLHCNAPVLLGRVLDVDLAIHVLKTGPQALRIFAARKLNNARLGVPVTACGPVHRQHLAFERMQAITQAHDRR